MSLKLDFTDLGLEFTTPDAMVPESAMTLYGAPGSWKTTIAASAVEVPELCPVLYLDAENSTASVAAKYGEHPQLDVLQLRSWTHAVAVLKRVAEQRHKYKTVVVDPINTLSHYLQIHMIRRVEEKRALARIPSNKLTPEQRLRVEELAAVKVQDNVNNSLGEATTSLPDYGVIGTKFTEIIYGLTAAPFFTIFVTHATDKVNDKTKQVYTRPDMAGSVGADRLRQKPHVVAFTQLKQDKEGKERCIMHFKGGLGHINGVPFEAKERLGGVLGDYMVDPTMPKLWSMMNQGKEAENG